MYFPMTIEEIRAEITQIDEEIIHLIARRQSLAGKIAAIKKEHGIPVHDNQRKNDVLDYVMKLAKSERIDPVPVRGIFETLIAMNEKAQRAAMEPPAPKKTRK